MFALVVLNRYFETVFLCFSFIIGPLFMAHVYVTLYVYDADCRPTCRLRIS